MKENSDISPVMALALLLVILAALAGLKLNNDLGLTFSMISGFVTRHQDILSISFGSILLNLFFIGIGIDRLIGYRKQGSRLRSLKNERRESKEFLIKLGLTMMVGIVSYGSLSYFYGSMFSVFENIKYFAYFNEITLSSLSVNIETVFYFLITLFFKIKEGVSLKKGLSSRFFKENHMDVHRQLGEWIDFYNTRRLHGSLKYNSPKKFISRFMKGEYKEMCASA
jgi:hypothetical protein